jgi:tetratricopeptide (TPR) repeat protein
MQIIVTDPELQTFKHVVETNETGEYSIILPEATHTYTYRLEKQGFEPFETSFKVPAGGTRAMNFTVLTGSSRAPDVFNAGNAAARDGDYATAAAMYRQAVSLDPTLVPAHAALAAVLLLEKDFAGAVETAAVGLELEPTNERLLSLRHEAYRAMGDEANAAKALEALVAASPERAAEDLLKRAGELFEAGRIGEAREVLEQLLQADQKNAKAHYLLALCLVNSGDPDSAKEHLAAFVELAPDDPDVAAAKEMLAYLE